MTNEKKHKIVVCCMVLATLIPVGNVILYSFLTSQFGVDSTQTHSYYIIRSITLALAFLSFYFLIPLKNKYANDTQKIYSVKTRNAAMLGAVLSILGIFLIN